MIPLGIFDHRICWPSKRRWVHYHRHPLPPPRHPNQSLVAASGPEGCWGLHGAYSGMIVYDIYGKPTILLRLSMDWLQPGKTSLESNVSLKHQCVKMCKRLSGDSWLSHVFPVMFAYVCIIQFRKHLQTPRKVGAKMQGCNWLVASSILGTPLLLRYRHVKQPKHSLRNWSRHWH